MAIGKVKKDTNDKRAQWHDSAALKIATTMYLFRGAKEGEGWHDHKANFDDSKNIQRSWATGMVNHPVCLEIHPRGEELR